MMRSPCCEFGCVDQAWRQGRCERHDREWLVRHPAVLAYWNRNGNMPLDCQCATPTPTPTDMCAQCLRVIAAKVRARREATR